MVPRIIAPRASNALDPTANAALPKTELGSQASAELGLLNAPSRSGMRAKATKRTHLTIGAMKSTASHNGSWAERSRLKQSITPAQRKGSEAQSSARNS